MKNPNTNSSVTEPIAIVGMSCCFPKANNLESFWNLLINGEDTIREIPKERWDNSTYYDPDSTADRKSHQKHASMLDDIHDLDSFFFNISPAEAIEMSPSQKLMLELVWQAMEDSSIAFDSVKGSNAGVYIGNIWNDFEHHRKHKNAPITTHSAVGQSSNVIANRVSFIYGFTGPSLVLDTGCSSSLVALHLACQSLLDGSIQMAFVGGVNHILDPDQSVLLSKFGGLSKKGKCSTFDAGADGFVRGEGAGVLMLKKLSDAERDGDKIHALIKGTSVNNNGFNVNLPATSTEAQVEVIEEAFSKSGITPDEVHYVEAHGTGTKLGDPTETKALGQFFSKGRNKKLHIGSVKTNIGHLEAAAGLAGLIKVVLAMRHKILPPSLNFEKPNPNIPFEELKLQVQDKAGEWPADPDESLKAGVNSFGWGGTNAHTILEEYKKTIIKDDQLDVEVSRYCLPVSAKSPEGLIEYIKSYQELLLASDEVVFQEICVAASLLKPVFEHSIVFSGQSKSEVLENIKTILDDEVPSSQNKKITSNDKIVFVFPGQGSQWLGMGKELIQKEPVFREWVKKFDESYRSFTDWILIDEIQATEGSSRMNEINVIQPAICAIQIALAKLWMSWGIQPHAVVGHSMGEVAAAFISGSLTIEEASCIICTRSNLMKKVSGEEGAMAMTELSMAEANDIIDEHSELSLAVNNSPKSTVLSGDKNTLTSVLLDLEDKGVFGRMVKVDVASHSVYMDSIKEDLRKALNTLRPIPTSITMYSTVRNKAIDGFELDGDYWVDNLRETVQFASLMEQMMEDNHTVFIEVSPHPVLTNAVNECAEHLEKEIISIPSIFRGKDEQGSIFKNLSELLSTGLHMNWSSFYNTNKAPFVDLPPYPFQRERYELEDCSEDRIDQNKSSSKFPLLGHQMKLAGMEHLHYWETPVSLSLYPYLRDHQVNGTTIFPGAAYVEIVLEAASQIHRGGSPMVKNLTFIRSLNLLENEIKTIQLRVVGHEKRKTTFEFFLKETIQDEDQWLKLAEGELHNYFGLFETEDFDTMQTYEGMDNNAYYDAINTLGIQYGKCFRNIETLKYQKGSHSNRLHFTLAPDTRIVETADKYRVHPALLDSCFQSVFFDVLKEGSNESNRTTFLSDIDDIQFMGEVKFDKPLQGEARLYPLNIDKERGTITVKADMLICNGDGSKVLKIIGVKAKIIDTDLITSTQENLKNWVYTVQWKKRLNLNKAAILPNIPLQTWVLFGDVYGLSTILVDKMQQVGIKFIHITPGHSFKKQSSIEFTMDYKNPTDYKYLFEILYARDQKINGILHMGGISYPSGEVELTAKEIEEEQVYGSLSVIHLLQQLEKMQLLEVPKLAIVTNGMEDIENDTQPIQLIHAPLCGVVRVAANELSQYRIKRYDLSFHPMLDEIDRLLVNLSNLDLSDREIALRGKDEYVPQLITSAEIPVQDDEALRFSVDGTYLITGFRGLAFEFIEWMIRKGARNFALISRSGKADKQVMESIENYKEQGCRFTIIRTDIANYGAVENALSVVEKTMPKLRGVVHAAGVIEGKSISQISEQNFLDTLSPKMKGAWNLHLLTKNISLDCFILFSSASSLIGLSGQASYVAANSFLDVLAHNRKKRGFPAQSINWGVIKDVGMVANDSDLEKYADAEGFEAVKAKDALSIYDTMYSNESAQLGVLQLNVSKMGTYYPDLARTTYFKSLLVSNEQEKSNEQEDFLRSYKNLDSIEMKQEALKELIIKLVARVIKSPVSKISSSMTFKGLGIDSLMAIQVRNLIERSLDLKLPVGLFWTYPSIREYTVLLLNQLQERSLEKPKDKTTDSLVSKPEVELFLVSSPNPDALQRIFCFHDAGGSASLYDNWAEHLGDQFELVVVELPGRGKNFDREHYKNTSILVDDLMAALEMNYLDKPFVFFGHSMGGLLAFELTRLLRRMNKSIPQKMFISSTPQLTSYDKGQIDPKTSDDQLANLFPYLKEKKSSDKRDMEILLEILRGDLELLANYEYKEEEPLAIPIIAIRGIDDLRVRHEHMEAWSKETTEPFQLISRPGGHRYIADDHEYITSLVRNEVTEHLVETK